MRYVPITPTADPQDEYLTEGVLALPDEHPLRRFVIDLAETLALAIILFALVQALMQNYVVSGSSMEPSVHDNELIIVNTAVFFSLNRDVVDDLLPFIDVPDGDDVYLFHQPQRGEVVIVNTPEQEGMDLIKRIIGVPGDVIQFDRSGGPIRINEVEIAETWLSEGQVTQSFGDILLGPGEYFVMGDNRRSSQDSRHWGTIGRGDIIGKALLTYWPPRDIGFSPHETDAYSAA